VNEPYKYGEAYEVTLRDRTTGNKWTMKFQADDFCHAEEQAIDALKGDEGSEIVTIAKDYA
jgi:hypothetical protein